MQTTISRPTRTCPRSAAAAVAVLLLLGYATALAEPVGRVLFAAGNVTATDPAGNMRVLERGNGVEEGDTIATGDGRLQVEFKDGGYFALPPGTRFRVDRYRYVAAGDAENSVLLSLLKGGLRTISGLVGKKNHNDYRMDTGVATIGIRGTEYALDLNSAMTGSVADGAIEVCNGAGCLQVQAGQAFFVPSLHDAPVLGERRAFLPPVPRAESVKAAPSNQDTGERELTALPMEAPTSGPGKLRGEPKAVLGRLPEPAVEATGKPSQGAASDKLLPPGLSKKIDGVISDPSGPPGLTKKNR